MSKKKGHLSKSEVKERKDDFVHTIYDHGGSRIFIDGESGDRHLIIDTFQSKEFAEYIEKCVRDYFNIN